MEAPAIALCFLYVLNVNFNFNKNGKKRLDVVIFNINAPIVFSWILAKTEGGNSLASFPGKIYKYL
jgi:hypothetical protein